MRRVALNNLESLILCFEDLNRKRSIYKMTKNPTTPTWTDNDAMTGFQSMPSLPGHPAGMAYLTEDELDIITISGCVCSPSAYTCSALHDECCLLNPDV